MKKPQPFSLLWPPGTPSAQTFTALDAQCLRDLELEHTLDALTEGGRGRTTVRQVFSQVCTSPEVIAYRQDILEDLWRQPELTARLQALAPDLGALTAYQASFDQRRSPTLHQVTWRLGELEYLVGCVSGLHEVFTQLGDHLQAAGWRTLRDRVAQTAQDGVYQHLQRELPGLLHTMRTKASVTIGVNLDSQLRPVAATLIAVNERRFTASSFMERLLGRLGEAFHNGIGPLHTVPEIARGSVPLGQQGRGREVNPLMVPLFRDLAKVLDTVCQPIARALRQYGSLHSGFLAALSDEMAFYLAAIRLRQRLHDQGLPVCRPVIAPMQERVGDVQAGYNLNLALHLMAGDGVGERIIPNDVHMGEDGRILILTGPNQGGKTTYTQMVGLCQILAQAGLWVPAAQARISPVDSLYTHYPIEENLEKATGRFGDEAQRLSEIFARATRHSLILLNESLSSTSLGESLYIAQDIVRTLRRMGTRVVFATHLHELAADVDQLNANTAGDSLIASLVASRVAVGEDGSGRSYKIIPGPPIGRSYAREIAAKYGISYDQLIEQLRQRGVVE